MWWPEDNFHELALSFQYVGLGTELRCLAWHQVPSPTDPLLPHPFFLRHILAVTQPILELSDQVILLPQAIWYLGDRCVHLCRPWLATLSSVVMSLHITLWLVLHRGRVWPQPWNWICARQLMEKKEHVCQVWHLCLLFWSHDPAGLLERKTHCGIIYTGQGPTGLVGLLLPTFTNEGRRPTQVLPSHEETPRLVINNKHSLLCYAAIGD